MTVIRAKTSPYLKGGKPAHRSQLVNEDDYTIVNTFGAEYRGLVNYYLLAGDVHKLSRVRWVMKTALLKTLACKHDSSVSKMAARYKAKVETPEGIRTCFEARVERGGRKPLVARFGGQPLKKKRNAVLVDRKPVPGIIRRMLILARMAFSATAAPRRVAGPEVCRVEISLDSACWFTYPCSGVLPIGP